MVLLILLLIFVQNNFWKWIKELNYIIRWQLLSRFSAQQFFFAIIFFFCEIPTITFSTKSNICAKSKSFPLQNFAWKHTLDNLLIKTKCIGTIVLFRYRINKSEIQHRMAKITVQTMCVSELKQIEIETEHFRNKTRNGTPFKFGWIHLCARCA